MVTYKLFHRSAFPVSQIFCFHRKWSSRPSKQADFCLGLGLTAGELCKWDNLCNPWWAGIDMTKICMVYPMTQNRYIGRYILYVTYVSARRQCGSCRVLWKVTLQQLDFCEQLYFSLKAMCDHALSLALSLAPSLARSLPRSLPPSLAPSLPRSLPPSLPLSLSLSHLMDMRNTIWQD